MTALGRSGRDRKLRAQAVRLIERANALVRISDTLTRS